jgi:hypothetical protein
MVKFHQPVGGKVDLTPGLRRSDKLKLGLMAGGAVLAAGALLFSLTQSRECGLLRECPEPLKFVGIIQMP